MSDKQISALIIFVLLAGVLFLNNSPGKASADGSIRTKLQDLIDSVNGVGNGGTSGGKLPGVGSSVGTGTTVGVGPFTFKVLPGAVASPGYNPNTAEGFNNSIKNMTVAELEALVKKGTGK